MRLGKYKRDADSIQREGENMKAVWSPDAKLIAVLVSLESNSIQFNSAILIVFVLIFLYISNLYMPSEIFFAFDAVDILVCLDSGKDSCMTILCCDSNPPSPFFFCVE